MSLLALPNELLLMLPNHLANLEDFNNASATCQTLRDAFSKIKPEPLLRLAAASSRVFFRPDPWFLVAATARQVGQWGLESEENAESLRAAFRGGIDSLLELCVSTAGITMAEIRRLYECRFEVINPVSDMIDRMAGTQWYETPDFWNGGVSEPVTIDCEPVRSLFQFVIYGELFESTLQAWLQPDSQLPKHSLMTRLDYVRYCIPDSACRDGSPGLGVPQKDVGPYSDRKYSGGDGLSLRHILTCGRWNRPWEAIRHQIGPDFDQEWRQEIWVQAAQLHGLRGLEILRPGGVEKWRERLQKIRSQVADLQKQPPVRKFGSRENPASDCPNLADELWVCVAGLWQSS